MELDRKHIFLIAGSALLVTAIVIGIILITKKPSDKDDKEENNKDKEGGDDSGNDNDPTVEPPPSTNPNPTNTSSIQNGQVVPVFNEENELDNSMEQLKGVLLYPKRKWQGGSDYANIRSSAEVNTDQGWYDPFDNLLTTIGSGTPIGKVITSTTGLYNSYAYTWFKVKLNKKVGFWGTTDEGFVRADTVTFVPFTYVKK
ncbi:hypothetical protein D3C71_563930 [compost metagenome]